MLEGEHLARAAAPVHRPLLRPHRRPAEDAAAHPHGVLHHRLGQAHPRQEAEGVSIAVGGPWLAVYDERSCTAIDNIFVPICKGYNSGRKHSERLDINMDTERSFYFRPGSCICLSCTMP